MMKRKLALVVGSMLPVIAMAEEASAATGGNKDVPFLAAGLCMGIAAAMGTFSQSRAASSALEGMARNPAAGKSLFTPLLLSMALMESLVLFAFVISIMLVGK